MGLIDRSESYSRTIWGAAIALKDGIRETTEVVTTNIRIYQEPEE
ncbi:hypothetical protein [Phormidium pseudopriestleyi]|nr:hypothetical protein [Phormidium pseudopriestleyi]